MAKKMSGLGRGIDAIFLENTVETESKRGGELFGIARREQKLGLVFCRHFSIPLLYAFYGILSADGQVWEEYPYFFAASDAFEPDGE